MSYAYLDNAATTPLRPEAREAMAPLLGEHYGNPSGSHRWAREARQRLDDARDVVAEFVGADRSEIVFTSGGTEADNLAVNGVAQATGRGVACSAVEHHAVLEPVLAMGGELLPVDGQGRLNLQALADRIDRSSDGHEPALALVSVMAANNETGATNDLSAVSDLLLELSPSTVLHTDAVAAAAWLDLATATARCQLVSISAHKVGGPQGIGALVVRKGTPLAAQLLGGGQEQERRSGTPNVAGAVGFAAALAATADQHQQSLERVEALRQRLLAGLSGAISGLTVLSPQAANQRTAGTLQVAIEGVERESLLFLLDTKGVAASWGSSCASGASETSHVLAAMGVDPELARGALRLSLGWATTQADVDKAVEVLPGVVAGLRKVAA